MEKEQRKTNTDRIMRIIIYLAACIVIGLFLGVIIGLLIPL